MASVCVLIGLVLCMFSRISPTLGSEDRCVANRWTVNPDADAKFTYLISLHEVEDDHTCGELRVSSVMYMAILEWAVNKLNAADYVPGVKIGFDVYGDCAVSRYTLRNVLDALGRSYPPAINNCSGDSGTMHLGIIGPTSSQATEAVLHMLNGTSVPVLAPYATLPELSRYSNFLRTTPSDMQQVKVIVNMMVQFGFTYVAGVYTDDNYGVGGMRAVKELAESEGICIEAMHQVNHVASTENFLAYEEVITKLQEQQKRSRDESLGVVYFGNQKTIRFLLYVAENKKTDSNALEKLIWIMSDFVGKDEKTFEDAQDVSKNVFLVSPSLTELKNLQTGVEEKWKNAGSSPNATVVDDLILSFNSNTGGPSLPWDGYMQPTLDAVYALAETLRRKHAQLCGNVTGMCDGLKNVSYEALLSELQNVNVSYPDIGTGAVPTGFIEHGRNLSFYEDGEIIPDATRPLYDINKYDGDAEGGKKFNLVGQYVKDALQLNTTEFPIQGPLLSVCDKTCPRCQTKTEFPYILLEGDLYLIGIFSNHEQNGEEPFQCGEFRKVAPDVIATEAFLHSLDRLGSLTGHKFGALVFDDCYSPVRTNLMMSSFMSGFDDLLGNVSVDPKQIVGVVGAPSSGVSVPLALFFSRLNINMVSPSASSPDLDDRINYPHFLRTVPSDIQQANAMAELISEMGWKFVSLLYMNNNYGSKGAEAFLRIAAEKKICVVDPPVTLPETPDTNYNLLSTIQEIRKQTPRVVVYFGTITRMNDIFDALNLLYDNTASTRDEFIFVASEDWGDDKRILQTAKSVARGSITLKNDIYNSADIGFGEYILNKNAENNLRNPWFKDFWTNYFRCNIEGSFDQRYDTQCNDERFTRQDIDTFLRDQRVIHVMNAVYAIGEGLGRAIAELCPDGDPVCDRLFKDADTVTDYIRSVELKDDKTPFRVFKDDGNGEIGFKILNVHENGDQYSYKEVGTYDGSRLTLNKESLKFYDTSGKETSIDATCTGDRCQKCVNLVRQTEPTVAGNSTSCGMIATDTFRLPDIIMIGVLGGLVLLLLVALLVVCCCFTCRIKASEKRLKGEIRTRSGNPLYVNEQDRKSRPDGALPVPPDIHIRNRQTNSSESIQEWQQIQQILNLRQPLPGERISGDNVPVTSQEFLDAFSQSTQVPRQQPELQQILREQQQQQQQPPPPPQQQQQQQQQYQRRTFYPSEYPAQSGSPYTTNNHSFFPESQRRQLQIQKQHFPVTDEMRPVTYPPRSQYHQGDRSYDFQDQQETVPNGYLTTMNSPEQTRPPTTFSQDELPFATLPRTIDRHMKANRNNRILSANSTERISRV
ncbi:hypothetical protein ScPMuIL_008486 [Solemya velum]